MTRSPARTRLAALGTATLLTGLGLAGCGSSTANEQIDQAPNPGTNTTIRLTNGAGPVRIQNAVIQPAGGEGGYQQGGTAKLSMTIFNDGSTPVTIAGVTVVATPTPLPGGDQVNGQVVLVGGPPSSVANQPSTPAGTATTSAGTASATPSAAGPAASPSGNPAASPSGNPAASPSGGPAASPSGNPSAEATGSGTVSFAIPPNSVVALQASEPNHLALTNLSRAMRYGDTIGLEFTFSTGDRRTLSVGFDTSESPAPRGTENLHQENEK